MHNDQKVLVEIEKNNKQAASYLNKDYSKALEYANRAFELAKQAEKPALMAQSLIYRATAYWNLGDLDNAYQLILESLEIAEKEEDSQMKAQSSKMMGNIAYEFGDYEEAISFYMRAIKLNENPKDIKLEADIINNIGEINREHGDYEEAIRFYKKSIALEEQMGIQKNRGITYDNLSLSYLALGDLEQAIHYNRLCLADSMENQAKRMKLYGEFTEGLILEAQGERAQALEKWLSIKEKVYQEQESYLLQKLIIKLTDFYIAEKDYENARDTSLELFKMPQNLLRMENLEEIYRQRAIIYEALQEPEKALKEYRAYYDLLSQEAENKKSVEKIILKTRFQATKVKQEKEIFMLKNIALKEKIASLEQQSQALERAYERMKTISEIGRMMTSKLNLEEILQITYEKLMSIMPLRTLAVGTINKEKNHICYKLYIEEGIKMPVLDSDLEEELNFSTWAIKNKEILWINDLEKEAPKYLKINHRSYPNPEDLNHSAIFCPLILKHDVIGVITVQKKEKHGFKMEDKQILKSISTYLAIAIYNAERSEALKKEIKERETAQQKLREINYRLRDVSVLDELTGVYNRRYFQESMEVIWKRAKREKTVLAIILVDIDRFKQYNDTYGHLEGDQCLKTVARSLNENVRRKSDFIARFGGDEFVIVLPYITEEGVRQLLEKIHDNVNGLKMKHETSDIAPHVTLSMGAAFGIPGPREKYEHMIEIADKALYQVKKKHRNGFECLPLCGQED